MTGTANRPRRTAPRDERGVGELVIDVSERVSTLVREEIELAKTEVSEKVAKLLRGSVVGIAAGDLRLPRLDSADASRSPG